MLVIWRVIFITHLKFTDFLATIPYTPLPLKKMGWLEYYLPSIFGQHLRGLKLPHHHGWSLFAFFSKGDFGSDRGMAFTTGELVEIAGEAISIGDFVRGHQ